MIIAGVIYDFKENETLLEVLRKILFVCDFYHNICVNRRIQFSNFTNLHKLGFTNS